MAADLDAVLITGAGASYPFGTPLMGGWCQSLVRKLASSPGYREATRLSVDLGPEDFERVLGEFLHQVRAFEEIKPLVPLTLALQPGQPNSDRLNPDGVMTGWHNTTQFHLNKIVAKIRESLYEQFAGSNLNLEAARDSYLSLFNMLGLTRSSRFVYATTNYDGIGETALSRMGFRPDWGELPAVNNYTDRQLDVTSLVDAVPRSVPVLHLHGRVGWYRRQDGQVYASHATQHEEGYGVPIVMLPDLNKTYSDDLIINALWLEFERALARAKRIFVLGHSLHDAPLIDAIARNVDAGRVLVGIWGKGNPPTAQPGTESVQAKAAERGWLTALLDFGNPNLQRSDQITEWLRRTED